MFVNYVIVNLISKFITFYHHLNSYVLYKKNFLKKHKKMDRLGYFFPYKKFFLESLSNIGRLEFTS